VSSAKQVSLFVNYLKANLAKELGRLHDWREHLWGRRYHSASPSDAEHDQIARFLYILTNGCKEKLVASPLDWRGVTSAPALYRGETTLQGTWFDRTAQYRAMKRGHYELFPSTETVHLTPLPFLQQRSAGEQRQFVVDATRQLERETAQMHEDEGTTPLGVEAILRQKPHNKPKAFKSSPAPIIHAADPDDFWTIYNARQAKVAAYRTAAECLKRGETDVRFLEGCFPPRLPFVESQAPT